MTFGPGEASARTGAGVRALASRTPPSILTWIGRAVINGWSSKKKGKFCHEQSVFVLTKPPIGKHWCN